MLVEDRARRWKDWRYFMMVEDRARVVSRTDSQVWSPASLSPTTLVREEISHNKQITIRKMRKVILSVWNIKITSCTCTVKQDSDEDAPVAQPTTDDVEDFDVFLVVVEEDDTEIFYDDNNLMMISISLPQKSLRQGFS